MGVKMKQCIVKKYRNSLGTRMLSFLSRVLCTPSCLEIRRQDEVTI